MKFLIFHFNFLFFYEAAVGIEPAHRSFADSCLTTWLRGLEFSKNFNLNSHPKGLLFTINR